MADKIDTTPISPRPPDSFVDKAAIAVPFLLSDIKPDSIGNVSVVAGGLVGMLQAKGHTLAAAEWAVHRLIELGMLTTDRIELAIPMTHRFPDTGMRFGPRHLVANEPQFQTAFYSIPEGRPAPFSSFQVIATPKIWTWWHAAESANSRSIEQFSDNPKDAPPICPDDPMALGRDAEGITLFDLALAIEEDDGAAKQLVRTWVNSKRLTATPIGKCPYDGRRQLYRLSELLSDAKSILSLSSDDERKYRQALTARVRLPRGN